MGSNRNAPYSNLKKQCGDCGSIHLAGGQDNPKACGDCGSTNIQKYDDGLAARLRAAKWNAIRTKNHLKKQKKKQGVA